MRLKSPTTYLLIPQPDGAEYETAYKFITDEPVVYDAYFVDAAEFFPENTFAPDAVMFTLEPEDGNLPSPREDPRIGPTVAAVFAEKFAKNKNSVVCFICASEDKKEVLRARKFDIMFESQDTSKDFIKIKIREKGIYGAVIYHRDNPAGPEIAAAAKQMLSPF
ncbi:DUF6169 family protein [Hymenobacter sp. DH14]|jgi:hypothetical protein|uniref:DUF6169 family protein n=1 Tax=Hymenobacter cyanobacteriorum TaxID=2926463 RepID=A0A9X1VKN3_9BACT|nr:DUF6169 family protein [Hymenobacter cyanobacteriorum]MCI1189917.1 DUF6169 family protein [Hymenobacter cyanobacteriorum]